MKGFICIWSYFAVSTKITSISVPLFVILLVGKSTTCDRLCVFIKVRSFDAALLFVRRLMFRLPQIRKVTFGCTKLFKIFSNSLRKRFILPVGALYAQKIINFNP